LPHVIFRWTDIDTLAPMLFGRPQDAARTISSIDGIAYLFQLDASTGDGYVEMFHFADGLAMVVFNCSWLDSRTFAVDDEGRSRLSFTLDLNMTLDVGSTVVDANSPAWRLMNNAGGVVTQETVSAGSKTVWVTLAFAEQYLDRYLNEPAKVRKLPQFQLFRTNPEASFVESFPLDHQLNLITSNIISLNVHDAVYLALAKAKAAELITVALDRLLVTSQDDDGSPIRLRAKDREAIRLARDILVANLADPPSIRELCAAVGVNRNKLHYGFREEFGSAPAHYLEEYRLEQAYARLRDSEDLIYQVAADVGYATQSSFATAFKRRYGLTPKEARREHRS
jgi:AraC-like DNA-binding protein